MSESVSESLGKTQMQEEQRKEQQEAQGKETQEHHTHTLASILGPAFVAAVAYVDPGNVAANITSGARYGYLLVWVLVLANAMSVLIQYQSAKLGIVTGKSLPEILGERMGDAGRFMFFAQAEVIAIATDLAELIGGAIALNLLFDLPLFVGGCIIGAISTILLLNGVLAHWGRALTYKASYGFWGLVILVCWQQIGYMMIIYIAGLQSLPTDVLEAAQVDGASGRQTMFRIIIPLMMPSITVCSFLTVTNGFKLYDQNLALTNGAPSNMSEGLALNITRTFYGRMGWEGVGQAKAVLFFILVAVIALIQNKLTTSKEVAA